MIYTILFYGSLRYVGRIIISLYFYHHHNHHYYCSKIDLSHLIHISLNFSLLEKVFLHNRDPFILKCYLTMSFWRPIFFRPSDRYMVICIGLQIPISTRTPNMHVNDVKNLELLYFGMYGKMYYIVYQSITTTKPSKEYYLKYFGK